MKFEQTLPFANLQGLRYFTDAWAIQVVKRDDRNAYIQRILESRSEVVVTHRLEEHLRFGDLPYRTLMLVRAVLRQLLNEPAYSAPVSEFHEKLLGQEADFVEWASKPKALAHLNPTNVGTYRAVLKAAWDTDGVDASEYHLLEILRSKLGITRRDHRIIEIQLGHLPGEAGAMHTVDEIEKAVQYLIKRGLVFRLQTVDGERLYLIPEEMAVAIREIMGIELISPAYTSLLRHLSVDALRESLKLAGQPFSGTREFLTARIIDGYISPKMILRSLSENEFARVIDSAPSVRRDGSREVQIRHLIKHYDRLEFVAVPSNDGPHTTQTYLQYYGDLAWRRHDVLRAAGVITKDLQIERRFEEATTALFTSHFGHDVSAMDGLNHPDGRIEIAGTQRLILWDCKSCETPYGLTDRLARQFLSYIAAAFPRVASPLLVIGPDFTVDSVSSAMRLKTQCAPGTEIGLIAADDLLWLAQAWKKRKLDKPLPWEVISYTGRLTRDVLAQRLKTFA